MLINKSDVPEMKIAEEVVFVYQFRGDVIVRALTLHDRLALAADKATDGPSRLVAMLSLCVLDSNRHPVYDKDEWYAFASRYLDSAMTLWTTAQRLSGMGEEVDAIDEKKDSQPNLGSPSPSPSDSDVLW